MGSAETVATASSIHAFWRDNARSTGFAIPSDSAFRGTLNVRQLDYLLFVETKGSGLSLGDADALPSKRIAAHILVEGAALFLNPAGQATALTAGDLLVRSITGGAWLHAPANSHIISIDLSAHLLTQHGNGTARPGIRVSRRSADLPSRSLYDFAVGMAEGGAASLPEGVQDIVANLIAMVLGATPAAAADAEKPASLATTRLTTIVEYLQRHFADPQLSPADVARHCGISTRYMNKLFEPTGRSFRQTLVALRMAACRAALCDPAYADQTIAEIAFNAGLNDLSQFNRQFRSAFGMTPRAMRAGAKAASAGKGERLRVSASDPAKSFSHQTGIATMPELITTGHPAWASTNKGRLL